MHYRLFLLAALTLCLLPLSSLAQSGREVEAEKDVQVAKQAQAKGNYAEAVAEYQAALKLMPGVPELQSDLGLAYCLRGEYIKAIEFLGEALRQKPDLLTPNFFLGLAYVRTSQYVQSVDPLKKAISLNPKLRQAYILLAGSYDELGKEDKALEVLESAEKIFPDNVEVLYNLGTLYYRLMVKTYGKMAQVAPESYRYDEVLGKSFEERSELPAAIYEYQQAIRKNSRASGLHYALGHLYWVGGQYAKAKEQFKDELLLYPENYQATWELGDIYLKEKQVDKALAYLETAVHEKPDLAQAYQDLGELYMQTDHYERAISYMKRAVQLSPEEPSIHYLLAQSYRRVGNAAEAQTEINLFVKLKKIQNERQTPSAGLIGAAAGGQSEGSHSPEAAVAH